MNQQKYCLNFLILPFLFTFSVNMAMSTTILRIIFGGSFEERQKQRQEQRTYEEIVAKIRENSTIAAVDHEINTIKNKQYKQILTELQRITNRPYNDLKKEIDEQRNLIKTLLKQKNDHAKHDPNIPNFITQKLCETISQYNINPNNIDLTYKISDTTAASAYSGIIRAGFFIIKPEIIDKPRITIHSPFLKQSEHFQLPVYHHEICHILLQHSHILTLTHAKLPDIILEEATIKPHTASEIYYKKKGISHLASLVEEEADIHASLSNSQIAYIQMQQRCSNWPHTHITNKQNHCEQLTTIYELMKQKEKLSEKASRF